MSTRTRVVVTGLGAVTPFGIGAPTFWENLIAGNSGIRRITQFDATGFDCQIAGEIPDFDPAAFIDHKEIRRMSRNAQIAIAAAKLAAADAGLEFPFTEPESERIGVLVGTAVGGIEMVDESIQDFRGRQAVRARPFAITSSIPNMAAFQISRELGTHGPLSCLVTACATGTQSIGEAAEIIRRGLVDVIIAGGTEAVIRDFSFAGFSGMKALPTHYNDDPTRASRPFDVNREGFVFSEGSGIVILESLEHARARGARIYAEILGHAASADAYHVAAPDPEAKGAIRAMRWAIADAQIDPATIGYINAHGSSTPINDPLETMAIKTIFNEQAYNIPISSTKSMIGHPMGASGALEAIACIYTLHTGVIHPTINLDEPDPQCDLDYVPNVAREAAVQAALSNSFGLGGQNACLVLGKFTGQL